MIKLIGDLGAPGSSGADMRHRAGWLHRQGRSRVSEKLDSPDLAPEDRDRLTDLIADLREQTGLVRSMFLDRAYEKGRRRLGQDGAGDRLSADAGRPGLAAAGVGDMAATVSRAASPTRTGAACWTQLKAKLVLRDLGGDLRHDRPMDEQDRGIYLQVAAQSGLENQVRNASLGGAETPHMEDRIVDLKAMQYLSGLGAYAQAWEPRGSS